MNLVVISSLSGGYNDICRLKMMSVPAKDLSGHQTVGLHSSSWL